MRLLERIALVGHAHPDAVRVVALKAERAFSARAGDVHNHMIARAQAGFARVLIGERVDCADKFVANVLRAVQRNPAGHEVHIRAADAAGNERHTRHARLRLGYGERTNFKGLMRAHKQRQLCRFHRLILLHCAGEKSPARLVIVRVQSTLCTASVFLIKAQNAGQSPPRQNAASSQGPRIAPAIARVRLKKPYCPLVDRRAARFRTPLASHFRGHGGTRLNPNAASRSRARPHSCSVRLRMSSCTSRPSAV